MGAQADYTGEDFSATASIFLFSDFTLVWCHLGHLWLRFASRSAEHGVYARWSHCRRCCNWVGDPCWTENVTTKQLVYQHSVYDSTTLQCSVLSFTVLNNRY